MPGTRQQGPVKKIEVLTFKIVSINKTFFLCVLAKELVDCPVQIQLEELKPINTPQSEVVAGALKRIP
jgi:hypothetical protein